MVLKYLLLGFFVKILTGFDDTITHIPLLAAVTKTKVGRIAFGFGILLAIICAILVALTFASIIRDFSFAKYIAGTLIFILAGFVYWSNLMAKPREKAEKKIIKLERISHVRFMKLFVFGFFASLVTVIDDVIAYAPLFLGSTAMTIAAASGILIATFLEIYMVIFFSRKIMHLPYKTEIATAGLVLLGIMTVTGIL